MIPIFLNFSMFGCYCGCLSGSSPSDCASVWSGSGEICESSNAEKDVEILWKKEDRV